MDEEPTPAAEEPAEGKDATSLVLSVTDHRIGAVHTMNRVIRQHDPPPGGHVSPAGKDASSDGGITSG